MVFPVFNLVSKCKTQQILHCPYVVNQDEAKKGKSSGWKVSTP